MSITLEKWRLYCMCFVLYLGMEFVMYGYAFSCGVVCMVEYSTTVSKFSCTVRMEYML